MNPITVVAAACVVIWGVLLLVWRGSLTAERRAGLVFALATAQPFVVMLMSPRTLSVDGAVSDVSHAAALSGRVLNLALMLVVVSLVVKPATRLIGSRFAAVAAIWCFAGALFAAATLSPVAGSARYELYFAAALSGVALGVRDASALATWSRWAARVVVAVSVGSSVIAPSWAFIGRGEHGYDRTIFGIPRLTGLAPHPNALAVIAVVALLMEIGFSQGRFAGRLVFGLAAAACILLTQSNTGYVAAAVGALCLVALRRPAVRWWAAAGAVAALPMLVYAPKTVVPARLQASEYVTSISGRTTIWNISLAAWRSRPLLGYGPGAFSPAFVSTHFPANLQVSNAHNQGVQTLIDSGVAGVIALIVFIAAALRCAWRARLRDRGLALSLLAAFVTFSFTETPLRTVSVESLSALLIFGLAITGAIEGSPEPVVEPETEAWSHRHAPA